MSDTTKRPLESTTSTSKKAKKSESPLTRRILLVDAVGAASPKLYHVVACRETMVPRHFLKRLAFGAEYTSLYDGMGADEMGGLVDEDGEDPEDRAEEILDWLRSMCTPRNEMAAGRVFQIDAIITLVEM